MSLSPLCRPSRARRILFAAIACGLTALIPSFHPIAAQPGDVDWPVYLGDRSSSQYSPLDQIDARNVSNLREVWRYSSGDARPDNRSQIQTNPLILNGVLYGISPRLDLFALNAATGELLWRYDPWEGFGEPVQGVSRGLVYWKTPSDGEPDRLFLGAGEHLHAVDPRTGQRIPGFADGGRLNLKEDLGRDATGLALQVTTPGILFEDLLILGMRVGEGPAPAAPGPIRAYDVRTGRLAWRFHTIPLPGEPGHETWPPDAYQHIGGANVWTGFALDVERGWVFCPTGAAAFDFWGGNRIGNNLYSNCLLALDARTGQLIWHYQFVRHDLWDRDLPAPPNLVTVTHNGKQVDAVAQVTKSGHVFLFDRETGTPLFPMEERAVPPSDLQGEVAAPFQPLPTVPEPFARQVFSYDLITDISPEAHRAVLDQFVRLRPHVPFMPPSREGTIIFPGFDGGAEWGGAAVDPEGVLYVNGNEMPWILTLVDAQGGDMDDAGNGAALYMQICAACHGVDRSGNPAQNVPALVGLAQRMTASDIRTLLETGKGVMPSFGFLSDTQQTALVTELLDPGQSGGPAPDPSQSSASEDEAPDSRQRTSRANAGVGALGRIPYTHTGYNRWLDPEGYPAVKPPWGTLNAIDLNTGTYRWRVPLGEFEELTARGVPPTGTENYGGPVITAGGLVFIAATKDEYIRAFERDSGRELWKARLPAGGYATPAVYAVGGRQYVVIACGGGKMGTRSGDTYVAFALPTPAE